MSDRPYEDGECQHNHSVIIRRVIRCQQCGKVYNEDLLEWEDKQDE